MYAHSKVVHFNEEKTPFSCYTCDAGFLDEASLRNHVEISSFHNKPDNCNMKVATKISLKRHSSKIYEEKKTFECSKCDMKYKARSTLKKHIHNIHGNKANKPIEKGMKNSFENYIIANPDGTFRCTYCGDHLRSQ